MTNHEKTVNVIKNIINTNGAISFADATKIAKAFEITSIEEICACMAEAA